MPMRRGSSLAACAAAPPTRATSRPERAQDAPCLGHVHAPARPDLTPCGGETLPCCPGQPACAKSAHRLRFDSGIAGAISTAHACVCPGCRPVRRRVRASVLAPTRTCASSALAEAAMTSTSPIEIRFDRPVGGPFDARRHASVRLPQLLARRHDARHEPLSRSHPPRATRRTRRRSRSAHACVHFSFVHQPADRARRRGRIRTRSRRMPSAAVVRSGGARARTWRTHCGRRRYAVALLGEDGRDHDDDRARAGQAASRPARTYTLICDGLTGGLATRRCGLHARGAAARARRSSSRGLSRRRGRSRRVALAFTFTGCVDLASIRTAILPPSRQFRSRTRHALARTG